MNEVAVSVEHLTKTYLRRVRTGSRWFHRYTSEAVIGLADASFTIASGQIVAYLGRNGAGKSTTIKCLTGILKPDSGHAEIAGFTPWHRDPEYFKRIGVVFGQRTQLLWDLPTRDSFELLGAQYQMLPAQVRRRTAELTELFGLAEILRTPVRSLSLGQRVLADISAALLHEPRVLFLDEPTLGLDVAHKHIVRQVLSTLRDRGVTILLTTHDMGDVEYLADRVIWLEQGRIVFDGSVAAFRRRYAAGTTVVVTFCAPLPQAPLPGTLSEDGLMLTCRLESPDTAARVVASLAPLRDAIESITIAPDTIEEIVRRALTSVDGRGEPRS